MHLFEGAIIMQRYNDEAARDLLTSPLYSIAFVVVITIIAFAAAWYRNRINSQKTSYLVKKCQSRSIDPEKLVADMVLKSASAQVSSIGADHDIYRQLEMMKERGEKIYKYSIEHVERMMRSRFIIIATCHEEEVFNERTMKRVFPARFMLKADRDTGTLHLYSVVHRDLNDLLNIREFGRLLLEALSAPGISKTHAR